MCKQHVSDTLTQVKREHVASSEGCEVRGSDVSI